MVWWSNTIKSDEEIVFFPSLGYYNSSEKQWHIQIHGWIFEPELAGEIRALFRKTLGVEKLQDGEESLFRRRSGGFFVDNERGKRITIAIAGKNHVLPQRSKANGHFTGTIVLSAREVDPFLEHNNIKFHAVLSPGDHRIFAGMVMLVGEEGTSIISDIDDTIKISNVTDKKELLKNTFFRPFQPVPGMAEYFQLLSYLPDAVFHYVSASPWQLYQALAAFNQEEGFPAGSFHMKLFRWKDRSVTSLFACPIEYKLSIIKPIMEQFPKRQFILIGDSGEKDPEVYAELVRHYPRQVKKILIRKITPDQDDARFQQVFSAIPKKTWAVFDHPEELP